ncbi:hypothetical protein KPH14_001039 [Odynerus spinipes]|uniref:Uncharacterized protein n=1 Tax=Odynerus spinipes TaxID=1348599 RepID=A0AAD9VIY4_9HYME|nr:hypothetical protein KPH14_001039 [Odynerus spinipes]
MAGREKQEENISEFSKHNEDEISNLIDEETNDINESDDVIYTYPIVTEKKGYMDLTDHRRNYEDMEARAHPERVRNRTPQESMESNEQDDLLERKDDAIVPETFTNENDSNRYTEESTATVPKITEKNKNDEIDVLNVAKENGNVSINSVHENDHLENDSNRTDLRNTPPEEAYIDHMERVIAANALPRRSLVILRDLYTRYATDKRHESTVEETLTETDIDASELSESKTDTPDRLEKAPIDDDYEKSITNPSLKESDNLVQSSLQEILSQSAILTASSIVDDEKSASLENTDFFANNADILTSTPKASGTKRRASSNVENKDKVCDVTSMTIENPFSDFTLQSVKLTSGLGSINIIREENDNEDSSVVKKNDNNNSKATHIDKNLPSSSTLSYRQNPGPLNVSKNVQLSHQQNIPFSGSYESSTQELVCRCPLPETDAASARNNETVPITNRIRRYFLSLLIDYLVPRQPSSTKGKVSRYF